MKIFVANTGRCGSLFVSNMFNSLTYIPSFHEPVPFCIGDTVKEVNTYVDSYSEDVNSEIANKLKQIEIDSIDGDYMESNQMFIKSYVDVVLENFDDVYCIYLYRDPLDTMLSWWKKIHNDLKTDWFLQSHWKKNILRTNKELFFFENARWQCHEVEKRFLKYKQKFTKTYVLDFEKLNDSLEWRRLFKHFRINHKDFRELPKVRQNEIRMSREEALAGLFEDWNKRGRQRFSIFPKELEG